MNSIHLRYFSQIIKYWGFANNFEKSRIFAHNSYMTFTQSILSTNH